MAMPSLEEMAAGLSRNGRLTPDGVAIAQTLARGRDYHTAQTMALLWAEAAREVARREDEVERLRQTRATAKKGKAGKEAKQ